MHIVIVTDQHPDSLGGAQVSIRLQRAYLEREGHRVTVVSPRHRSAKRGEAQADPHWYRGSVIELPSLPITRDRDYGVSWPGRATLRRVERALEGADPVDLVHVQGDFWGALIGYQLARRLGVPVVNTMHNNLDVGTRAVTPLAGVVFWALGVARRLTLGRLPEAARGARGGWRYLAALAAMSDRVIVPSGHFARDLAREGVPGPFEVVPTGVDDDAIDLIRVRAREASEMTRFVWCGRMSREKRIIELLQAFTQAVGRGIHAELVVVGAGLQFAEAKTLVRNAGLAARVRFTGALPHDKTLTELYHSDALVQTSIGFETQGMTPYEATALGTPTIFSDPDIAAALHVAPSWVVEDGSVRALADTLILASEEVQSGRELGQELRIPNVFSNEMRQSYRTREMLEVYESALAARA